MTQIKAVVGFVSQAGELTIPPARELSKYPGIKDQLGTYGIRTEAHARQILESDPDLSAVVYASRDTRGEPEFVAKDNSYSPPLIFLAEVESEFLHRNHEAVSDDSSSDFAADTKRRLSRVRGGEYSYSEQGIQSVEQRENDLLFRYQSWLNYELDDTEVRVRHPDSSTDLRIDAIDSIDDCLIEAKSDSGRYNVLHALAQLLDYSRLRRDVKNRAILLPAKPETDLINLAHSHGIHIYFESETGGFEKLMAPVARRSVLD